VRGTSDRNPARVACEAAAGAPDDSFVWWAVAARSDRAPSSGLAERVHDLFRSKRPEYFARHMHTAIGTGVLDDDRSLFLADEGEAGALLVGPHVALPPGTSTAVFTFEGYRADRLAQIPPSTIVAVADVVVGDEQTPIARREIRAEELPRVGEQVDVAVDYELPDTAFAGETRVISTGAAPLAVARAVCVTDSAVEATRRAPSRPLGIKGTRMIKATAGGRAMLRRVVRLSTRRV
jgi:hypothetical protein